MLQPDPGAGLPGRQPVEDLARPLGVDAGALVLDRDRGPGALVGRLDEDSAAAGCPRQRVEQHVGEHLRGVNRQGNPQAGAATHHRELHAGPQRLDRKRVDDVAHDGIEQLVAFVDRCLGADGPAREVARASRPVFDDGEGVLELGGRGAPGGARLGDPAEQHRQGIGDVVQRPGDVLVRVRRRPFARLDAGDRGRTGTLTSPHASEATTSPRGGHAPDVLPHGGQRAPGPFEGDVPRLHDHGGHSFHVLAERPGRQRDRAGVQPHVPPLDAVGRQGPYGGEVGRQAHRGGDGGQLLGVGDGEHAQREPARRVDAQRAAHRAERERQLERPSMKSPSRRQMASGAYWPLRAAKAWAPASTARQSLPVAITTASMPFMMPLLCVAARYGSSSAKREAATMPSMTSAPTHVVGREGVRGDPAAHAHAAACRTGSTGCAGRRAPRRARRGGRPRPRPRC